MSQPGSAPWPVPPAPPARRTPWGFIIAFAGVVVAVLAVAGWFAWHDHGAQQQARNTEQLSNSVMQSMQQKFDSDPNFSKYDIKVDKVTLIKESGNKYAGIAAVHTARSGTRDVASHLSTIEQANAVTTLLDSFFRSMGA